MEASEAGEASSTTASQRSLALASASFQRAPAPMPCRSRKMSSAAQPSLTSQSWNALASKLSWLEWEIKIRATIRPPALVLSAEQRNGEEAYLRPEERSRARRCLLIVAIQKGRIIAAGGWVWSQPAFGRWWEGDRPNVPYRSATAPVSARASILPDKKLRSFGKWLQQIRLTRCGLATPMRELVRDASEVACL